MQIRKYKYIKLGDDVPEDVERVYNKALRREQYLTERSMAHGVVLYGSEADLYMLSGLPREMYDPAAAAALAEQEEQHEKELQALRLALQDFKKVKPYEYELIREYFLGGRKVTHLELAKKWGKPESSIRRSIKRSLEQLRDIVVKYINLNE